MKSGSEKFHNHIPQVLSVLIGAFRKMNTSNIDTGFTVETIL